jgi:acid phosphatase (class A)
MLRKQSVITYLTVFTLHALGCATAMRPWSPVFLSKNELSAISLLSSPPSPGSIADRADFDRILLLQNSRTTEDCKRAGIEVRVSLDSFFGPPYGPLSKEEVLKWNPLFEKVRRDSGYFSHQAKDHWKRPRPYVADSRVHPCIDKEKSYAYPSGHATLSRTFARVLAEIDPARKNIFAARANQIAEDRVLGGVHHPSDIEAAKQLGDRVFDALQSKSDFLRDLDQYRARGGITRHSIESYNLITQSALISWVR